MLKGIAASEGIGIGYAVILDEKQMDYISYTPDNLEEESVRLDQAVKLFVEATSHMAEMVKEKTGQKEAEILEGQILMLSDPTVIDEMKSVIRSGKCCEDAVSEVCDSFIRIFSSMEDEMMRQRASDLKDIRVRLLSFLTGKEEIDIGQLPPNSIIITKELTPSMTAGMKKENVAAILTETGGKTSHAAILARAMEIPAVLSLSGVTTRFAKGKRIIVDGSLGEVIDNLSEDIIKEYEQKYEAQVAYKNELKQYRDKKTLTKDGLQVEIFCNIGNIQQTDLIQKTGGEGIGLFRTEFLFMEKTSIPTEEEQFQAYRSVALAMNGSPVIIRTLDAGGDKDITYLNLPKEENPFLGYRAIRVCLNEPTVYKPQLRALLRAGSYGDVRIMIPMITCLDELRAVRKLASDCMRELEKEKKEYCKDIKIGIMIETPAAVAIADILAKEADFFSIGTNDLIQYTMAADRGNAKVAYLYSVYQPAVLRNIKHVITCAKKANIPVGMCGESASDPYLIPVLLSFGLDEFSVSPSAVMATRKVISEVSMQEVNRITDHVMEMETEEEIREYLRGEVLYGARKEES